MSTKTVRVTQTKSTFGELKSIISSVKGLGLPDVSRRTRTLAGLERLREHALPGALERMLAVMAPEDLKVRLECEGYLAQRLEHEEALYRVTQEALSNVIRHARAHNVHVSASLTHDQVVLRIADDGRGIDTEFRPGIGLSSMRTRLETGGGHLRVTPNTPSGTLIEARLPRADR